MTGWLLDTNVVSELLREVPDAPVQTWASANDVNAAFISILTLAEYDKGVENLPPGDPRRSLYGGRREKVQAIYARRTLSLTDAVVRRWGAISGKVKRNTGHPPHPIDTLLAATAIEHGLTLVTRNTRDAQQSGAIIFNPWL